jgi:hypothetical protein
MLFIWWWVLFYLCTEVYNLFYQPPCHICFHIDIRFDLQYIASSAFSTCTRIVFNIILQSTPKNFNLHRDFPTKILGNELVWSPNLGGTIKKNRMEIFVNTDASETVDLSVSRIRIFAFHYQRIRHEGIQILIIFSFSYVAFAYATFSLGSVI